MSLERRRQAARFRKEPRAPTVEDLKQAEIIDEVGRAAVAALRPLLETNRDRLLRSLQKYELDAITVAMISRYIAKRQELEAADVLNDRLDDIPLAA